MRNFIIVGMAFLGMAGAASAGEGNGEPFPGPTAVVTTVTTNAVIAHRDQDPYQYRIGGTATNVTMAAVTHRNQDPYQFRMAGQMVRTGVPVEGPQSGTASASTTRGLTAPTTAGPGSHG